MSKYQELCDKKGIVSAKEIIKLDTVALNRLLNICDQELRIRAERMINGLDKRELFLLKKKLLNLM